MIKRERLPTDFFYRLNVIAITIPPLRERKEDIGLLCNHFLEKYLKSTSKEIIGFSDEAIRNLEEYEWPGNVRELENVVERAISLTKNNWIGVLDLHL